MKRKKATASPRAVEIATKIAVELFGEHCVQQRDVDAIAAIVDEELCA